MRDIKTNRTHDLLLRSLVEGRQDFENNCELFKKKLNDPRLKINRFDKVTLENAHKLGLEWTVELSTAKLKKMNLDDLQKLFEKYGDEFNNMFNIVNPVLERIHK